MKWLGTLRQRFALLLSQSYWVAILLIGLFLVFIGTATKITWLVGIGGSLLSAVIVSLRGPATDKVYQDYLRLGVVGFWPSRDQYTPKNWVEHLSAAKQRCTLLGQAHGEWCRDENFSRALIDRLRAGVAIEIFFLDPNGSAAAVRHREDRQRLDELPDRTRKSIGVIWEIREQLSDSEKERLGLYVYEATPSLGLTWIDGTMFVTHYLAGSINRTSPLLRIESRLGSDTLYAVYAENVRKIRDDFSTRITNENVAQYRAEGADGQQ